MHKHLLRLLIKAYSVSRVNFLFWWISKFPVSRVVVCMWGLWLLFYHFLDTYTWKICLLLHKIIYCFLSGFWTLVSTFHGELYQIILKDEYGLTVRLSCSWIRDQSLCVHLYFSMFSDIFLPCDMHHHKQLKKLSYWYLMMPFLYLVGYVVKLLYNISCLVRVEFRKNKKEIWSSIIYDHFQIASSYIHYTSLVQA